MFQMGRSAEPNKQTNKQGPRLIKEEVGRRSDALWACVQLTEINSEFRFIEERLRFSRVLRALEASV